MSGCTQYNSNSTYCDCSLQEAYDTGVTAGVTLGNITVDGTNPVQILDSAAGQPNELLNVRDNGETVYYLSTQSNVAGDAFTLVGGDAGYIQTSGTQVVPSGQEPVANAGADSDPYYLVTQQKVTGVSDTDIVATLNFDAAVQGNVIVQVVGYATAGNNADASFSSRAEVHVSDDGGFAVTLPINTDLASAGLAGTTLTVTATPGVPNVLTFELSTPDVTDIFTCIVKIEQFLYGN